MINLVDVYVVTGDYGNAGGGSVIGVFTDRDAADKAKIGRGSMDCGGDGRVDTRKGYIDGDNVYLVSGPLDLNKVLIPREVMPLFDVVIIAVGPLDGLSVKKAVKEITGISFLESAIGLRHLPWNLVQNLDKYTAKDVKTMLEKSGATVEIK